MITIVPIKPLRADVNARCSDHPCCEGPHLINGHEKICDAGDECDDEKHWHGCPYCAQVLEEL